MSNNPFLFSQSADNGSNVTLTGAVGNNNKQDVRTEKIASGDERQFSKEEVITLLAEIEEMVRTAALPNNTKEEAVASLVAAKKAMEKEEPKKESAAINLKDMAETLENASKTLDAGKSLWEEVQPHLGKVVVWLGTAAASFW
jgi:xanthine dehydrogenase molybdopterin-binding subunit B